MAFAESDPDRTAAGAELGEEVEIFARYLDECTLLQGGSASEQRARIFKLLDHYYVYARETADVLRERRRLARLARGGSNDSSSSGDGDGDGGPDRDRDRVSGSNRETRTRSRMRLRGAAVAALTDKPQQDEVDRIAADAQRWEEEAQTWDLLRRLLPLRYRNKPTTTTTTTTAAAAADAAAGPKPPPQTRKEYWADFLASEPKARERQTVLAWLQSSATRSRPSIDEVVQDLQQCAERGEILAHGWLHTRGAIKQHKRLLARAGVLAPDDPDVVGSQLDANANNSRPLVTQLDPDVVTRQAGRALATQDAFFEQAIWLGCYELLRRGARMAAIREWCAERTEVWRAAALSALPLSNDDDDNDGNDGNDDGNSTPDFACLATVLWRRLCYRLAKEDKVSRYERAVYGLLAGDIASVEAISSSAADWDDLMFAKYNAVLRAQFDAYLLRQADPAAAHALLLQHGDVPVSVGGGSSSGSSSSGSTVHASASSSGALRDRDDRARKAANTPAKALQAAVLEERLDSYLYQQGALLAENANSETASKLLPKYDNTPKISTNNSNNSNNNNNQALIATGTNLSTATTTAPGTHFIAPTDSHGLRILAHVLIIVSALDKLDGKGKDVAALGPMARRHQTEEHVIASYTGVLQSAHMEELIPLYASKLLGERAYTNLAINLINLEDRPVQTRLLHLMRRLGLDVVQFATTLPPLFLADVADKVLPEAKVPSVLPLLQDGPPTLKFGRMLQPGLFGPTSELPEDPDDLVLLVDKEDELLIRAMEWLMLVDNDDGYGPPGRHGGGGLLRETCDYGVRIYTHFFTHQHLAAARLLASRVPCAEIVRQKTRFGQDLQDDSDPSWWDDLFGAPAGRGTGGDSFDEDMLDADGVPSDANALNKEQVAAYARPLFEFECLVNALDCLETTAVIAAMVAHSHNVDPARDRSVAKNIDDNARFLKGFMKPLLKDWLLTVDDDPVARRLRATYLPPIIIGFASTLQFAGTTSSRDYLLECMELAAVVAAPDSDVAPVLVETGRMGELVASFASCSKALAIWTSDLKKGPGAGTKKLRELGWSRELWSVKP